MNTECRTTAWMIESLGAQNNLDVYSVPEAPGGRWGKTRLLMLETEQSRDPDGGDLPDILFLTSPQRHQSVPSPLLLMTWCLHCRRCHRCLSSTAADRLSAACFP